MNAVKKSWFYRLNEVALWLGGLSVLGMSLLSGADIIMTQLFHRPIDAIYEATQTLMVIVVFLGLGIVHLNRAHISVDILYERMNPVAQRLSDVLTLLLMTFFFGALAWRGWQSALGSWAIREYSVGIIAFPIYPARFALAIGSTLAVLCCLGDFVVNKGRFRKPHKDIADRDLAELSAGG